MRSVELRSARPLTLALVVLAVLALVPSQSRAAAEPPGAGEIRRRIEQLDGGIARAQTRLGTRTGPSNLATWLLFKAHRTLDLARLSLQDARVWGSAPDEMRRSLLGPTTEKQAVIDARARYRRLLDSRRVGGALERTEALQARLAVLEATRSRLVELLAGVERPTFGPGIPDAGEWARAFLAEIGAPGCEENMVLMVAWQAQESTDAAFNPLATTHAMPGATSFNSVGVKNYRSVAQGLDASRETLEDGAATYGYDAILSSLRACNDAEATAWFVNASAWCRGCTAGAYLTGLLPAVRADYATYAAR